MPVKKKTKAPGQGMTAKQMKRRKPISADYMLPIEPLTDNRWLMADDTTAFVNRKGSRTIARGGAS